MRKLLTIIPLLILTSLLIANVNYRFTNVSVDDGLSRNTISGILKDKYGFVWIATWNGLNRFDGYGFTVFKCNLTDSTSMSNNRINSIALDDDLNLWAFTYDNLLNKFDYSTQKFTRYSFKGAPLSKSEKERFKNVRTIEHKGYRWVAEARSKELIRKDLNSGSVAKFLSNPFDPSSMKAKSLFSLFVDTNDIVWIGSYSNGVDILDLNQKPFYSYRNIPNDTNSIQSNSIRALAIDNLNRIWVGTQSSGLCIIDPDKNTFQRVTPKNKQIRSIFCDSRNNVWVGNIRNKFVERFSSEDLSSEVLFWEDHSTSSIIQNVYNMLEDHKGNIWLAGINGLCYYSYETGKFKPVLTRRDRHGLKFIKFRRIIQENNNTFWIASEGNGLIQLRIIDYGSHNERYIVKSYTHNSKDLTSISADRVYSLAFDVDSNLWLGTAMGLNLFNAQKGTFKLYNEKHGLPDIMIYGILSDKKGNLWLSHGKGLTKFDSRKREAHNFTKDDGLQGNEFSEDAYYQSPGGKMYFGGTNGFTLFHPDSMTSNTYKPIVVLTSLKILGKEVGINEVVEKRRILTKSIYETESITLNYRHKSFTIEFAALHFSNPKNNRYKYMLDGYNSDWVVPSKGNRTASYTNLDPGTYTFKVIASNNDKVWNLEGVSLEIIVKPPFWKTWAFRIAIVLIVVGAAYYLYLNRVQNMREQQEYLQDKIREEEKIVAEKVKEVEKQKEEIQLRDEREQENRFINNGLVKISDIISSEQEELNRLCQSLISGLLEYIKAFSGVIYVVKQQEGKEPVLEIKGHYGIDKEKLAKNNIDVGEGYVGTCFKDNELKILDNIPETYSKINSGLGQVGARFVILIPLSINRIVNGVIEIGTIKKLEKHEVNFLKNVAQSIASAINTFIISQEIKVALENSNFQKQELLEQEEEMRQHIEEMTATKEETQKYIEKYETIVSDLTVQKEMLNVVNENISEFVFVKNRSGYITHINKAIHPMFPTTPKSDILNKPELSLLSKNSAKEIKAIDDKIFNFGKSLVKNKMEIENRLGEKINVNMSRFPLHDNKGQVVALIGIIMDPS